MSCFHHTVVVLLNRILIYGGHSVYLYREKAAIFTMNQRAFEMILTLRGQDVLWLGRW